MNSVVLVGNVGKDPIIRASRTGLTIASFSVATKRNYKNPQTGQEQEIADWSNVVAFGHLAEAIGNQLHKGSYVTVIGRMNTRSYDDKNGQKKWVTEVVASTVAINLSTASTQPQQQGGGTWGQPGQGHWGQRGVQGGPTNGNFEKFGRQPQQFEQGTLDGFNQGPNEQEDIPF